MIPRSLASSIRRQSTAGPSPIAIHLPKARKPPSASLTPTIDAVLAKAATLGDKLPSNLRIDKYVPKKTRFHGVSAPHRRIIQEFQKE